MLHSKTPADLNPDAMRAAENVRLPASAASQLQGTTPEQLAASAQALAEARPELQTTGWFKTGQEGRLLR